MAARKRKEKPVKVDGLSSADAKRIKNAVRQVWHWSHMWRLVKKRCEVQHEGHTFSRCENPLCPDAGALLPKIYVDHIEPAGSPLSPGYIERMFVSSDKLQGLCKKCHAKKTREEKKLEELAERGMISS